jgi:hypothetical protein
MRQAFFFLFFYSLLLSKFLMLAPCNLYFVFYLWLCLVCYTNIYNLSHITLIWWNKILVLWF